MIKIKSFLLIVFSLYYPAVAMGPEIAIDPEKEAWNPNPYVNRYSGLRFSTSTIEKLKPSKNTESEYDPISKSDQRKPIKRLAKTSDQSKSISVPEKSLNEYESPLVKMTKALEECEKAEFGNHSIPCNNAFELSTHFHNRRNSDIQNKRITESEIKAYNHVYNLWNRCNAMKKFKRSDLEYKNEISEQFPKPLDFWCAENVFWSDVQKNCELLRQIFYKHPSAPSKDTVEPLIKNIYTKVVNFNREAGMKNEKFPIDFSEHELQRYVNEFEKLIKE